MEIKNEEIEYAAQVLLNDPNAFYTGDLSLKTGERAAIIKSMESKNILACPGSGKTTVLLAKLLILGNRAPFGNGRGICVFTHTNVAIEEIKHKLGSKTDSLFSYPNFFGTIQQFVNKYLATPSFVNKNGFRPRIGNEYYYEAVRRKYLSGSLRASQPWIQAQIEHSGTSEYGFIGNLRFNFQDRNIITKDFLSNEPFVGIQSPTYQLIQVFKNQIFNDGYLCYDDAYVEAFEQLNNTNTVEAIRNRFQYVFVDEMQDSGFHQLEVLDRLFDNQSEVVYQRFGDVNQAIYSDGKHHGAWQPLHENCLQITETKRFPISICQTINTLRINKRNEANLLTSGVNQQGIRPKMILFAPHNTEHVIAKYAQIIKDSNIPSDRGHYAIGRIAKETPHGSTLVSYYPNYARNSERSVEVFQCLEAYLMKSQNRSFKVKERYESIINSILHLLETENLKNEITGRKFTKRTFFAFMNSKDESKEYELKERISSWLQSESINKEEVVNYIIALISEFWNHNLQISHSFFTDNYTQGEGAEINAGNRLSFYFPPGTNEELIEINVNTINGEKGRTHSSTLYLETYLNRSYDVQNMLECLAGSSLPEFVRGAKKGQLNLSNAQQMLVKFGFVGMSRAQKLLCVAVRCSAIDQAMETRLQNNGWDINKDLC